MAQAAPADHGLRRDGRSEEARAWRQALLPYAHADVGKALFCLATSIVPYLALCVAMYLLLSVSYALVLVVAVVASGFLLRTYIVFHDCAHGSFLPSRRANALVGVLTGLTVYTPFHSWRVEHAGHHATAGDLDRRGTGDVATLTVAEYQSRQPRKRMYYWLFRQPWVMFTLGPIWSLALQPRLVPMRARRQIQRSHLLTDVALAVVISALCLTIGWRAYLAVQLPTVLIAGAVGVWLFYVQHQFEGVYWRRSEGWSYFDAGLHGSSYLKLPRLLQFFTGNIGLHHVHHLNARIPNYSLQRVHEDCPFLHEAPTLSLWDGLRATRFKLFDEEAGRLVTFAEARARARQRTPTLAVAD
jgi:omega-6 fatty acid desaturase (delta-12 desaturase)